MISPISPGPFDPKVVTLSSVLARISPDDSRFPLREEPGYGNQIGRIRLLLLGGESTGKSTTAEAIAVYYHELTGGDGKFLVQTGGVSELFRREHLSGSFVPLWVLVAEDMTLADLPPEDRRKWFRIRHIIRGATGYRRGLVVSVSNVHTFYGLHKDLRTEFDGLIIKSVPTNRNDRSMLRALLGGGSSKAERDRGEQILGWLENKSLLAIRDPAQTRYALAWTRDGQTAFVDVPLVTPILTDVTPKATHVSMQPVVVAFAAFILTYAALIIWITLGRGR